MSYYARAAATITRVQQNPWYAGLLIALALGSGVMLSYEWWPGRDEATFIRFLGYDFYIACFFLLDFTLGFIISAGYPSRRAYLRDNWMNLVSSIPLTTELTQVLRILRVWRAWRVFRAGVGVWSMGRFVGKNVAVIRDEE